MTPVSFLGRLPLLLVPLLAALLPGCATAPVTYRVRPNAETRVATLKTVVAPLDAELSELSAGGLLERHDDWTAQAVANLNAALTAETGWTPPSNLTPAQAQAVQQETQDVEALLRAITLNHLLTTVPGRAPNAFPVTEHDLNYDTGPLTAHSAALGKDSAVLFVFVRNSYATAGRKALLGLSLLGAGLTGVAIIPAMGSDVMSAALVESDGAVLWFNVQLAGADPRTPDGARQLAKQILAGLPKRNT